MVVGASDRCLDIVGLVLLATLLIALPLSSSFPAAGGGCPDPATGAGGADGGAGPELYRCAPAKQGNQKMRKLVDGFNEMLAQIQERGAALESARDEMELRVLRRTAELANERRLLRTLIDNLPDIVFAKDAQSRFVLANTACGPDQLGAGQRGRGAAKDGRGFCVSGNWRRSIWPTSRH